MNTLTLDGGAVQQTKKPRDPMGSRGFPVEMGGIEPPSDVVLSGLLRAQFTSDFLGPSRLVNRQLIQAQSSKSPTYPDDGGK